MEGILGQEVWPEGKEDHLTFNFNCFVTPVSCALEYKCIQFIKRVSVFWFFFYFNTLEFNTVAFCVRWQEDGQIYLNDWIV